MRETTSTEFLEWREFFKWELRQPRREDYYAAQVAAEIMRTRVKKPKAVKIEHFLLKFAQGKKTEAQPPPDPAERERRVAVSKAHWAALLSPHNKKGVPNGNDRDGT